MLDSTLLGIRVLDLTRLLPGPYASLILADLGAEVIKVEQPPLGDPMRYALPGAEQSPLFDLVNRGKKSLTLELKAEEGRAILLKLAERADVWLEGFRPGVMSRLGLSYDQVAAANPRVVYASLSGYGQSGPYAGRAGHDANYLALAGFLDLSGSPQGPPVIPGITVADFMAGLWTALGIVAALLQRGRHGCGQYLDISMLDSVLATLTLPVADWLATGRVPERGRMPFSGGWACYNVYETADGGYMSLAALEPQFWQAFCQAVGRLDWQRRQQDEDQEKLGAEMAALFRAQPQDHWVALFAEHDCCCEPVLALDAAFSRPQAVRRGLLREGRLATPLCQRKGHLGDAPKLGEHTVELLAELGYSATDIDRLRQHGVL